MAIEAPAAPATGVDSMRAAISSPRRQTVIALIVYTVVSLEFFGVDALPHLGRVCACSSVGNDPGTFMWFLSWWPHALLHGINPFYSSALFAPDRLALGAATQVPGAALVMAPVTLLFGPLVSYNLIALAAPALAALFAFLLFRYVSGSFAGSLVGGYVFGFTAYMLGQMLGHLNLVLAFPIPAGVHLVLRLIDGRIGSRRFIALMALDLLALITFSTELALTFVVLGVITFALVLALAPDSRQRVRAAIRPTVIAGALAAIVTSPFIYYAVKSNAPAAFAGGGDLFGGDALGFLIPTRVTALASGTFGVISSGFNGNDLAESGIYLGIPFALIMARYVITRWRLDATRLLFAVLVIVMVLLLGSHLHIDSKSTISLPWRLIAGLPLIKQALPVRLGVYMYLLAGVIVSLWLARPRPGAGGAAKWALVAAGIAFVFPNLSAGFWHTRPTNPSFFTTGEYRRYLHRGEAALALPFAGYGMLWQADTGMWFRLAGGNLAKVFPANYLDEPVLGAFYHPPTYSQTAMLAQAGPLQGFLTRHHVGAVVVAAADSQQWPSVLAKLGMRPIETGGVLFYRVPQAVLSGRAAP
jgi:hypothetical protein